MPYCIQKAPTPPPLVVQLQLHSLQEDQNTKDMRIENGCVSGLRLYPLPKLSHTQLNNLIESRCNRILRLALVKEPTAKCAVGLNKAFQGFSRIVVDQAFESFATC